MDYLKEIRNENIPEEEKEYRKVLYEKIGRVVELSQLLEYNLRLFNAYDKIFSEEGIENVNIDLLFERFDKAMDDFDTRKKDTLGRLNNAFKKHNFIEKDIKNIFDLITKHRNLIVHNLFKSNLSEHFIEKRETVLLDYLDSRITDFVLAINLMLNLNNNNFECYNEIKSDLEKMKLKTLCN